MEFSVELLKNTVLEEVDSVENGIEFIESSDWISEGKYEYKDYIFKHEGKYYRVGDTRSGSYYSDYYYESTEEWGDVIECEEVVKQEVITYEWVAV